LQLIAYRKSDQNLSAVDPWTLVHLGIGLGIGLMGIGTLPALAGAVLYEVGEKPLEEAGFGKTLFNVSKPETRINSAVDVAVFMVGVKLGHAWNRS
jgi:1,4-dihydroxy-2-naphthoate octaprenyltransferase